MVSVVIPVYNEEKVITRCLDALLKQTDSDYEVILVDNNCTDRTIPRAAQYSKRLTLRIIKETKKGRGSARRTGFATARSSIIFSTDADAIVPPHWIAQMIAYLHTHDTVAVSGTCRFIDCPPKTRKILNYCQPLSMRLYRIIFGHYWLSGFNFAITKIMYEKSGGFNASLNGQEDTDLAFRVSILGNIKFVSNVSVQASGRRFQKGLLIGLHAYLTTFISYFLLKNGNIQFTDDR